MIYTICIHIVSLESAYISTYISASIDCEWMNIVLVHMTKSPLIFPPQVVLIFLVDCFHHVRSAHLERHEEPEAGRVVKF